MNLSGVSLGLVDQLFEKYRIVNLGIDPLSLAVQWLFSGLVCDLMWTLGLVFIDAGGAGVVQHFNLMLSQSTGWCDPQACSASAKVAAYN